MAAGVSKKSSKSEDLDVSLGLLEYDEPDALPPSLRYNNFDMSCTIISISTYLFDLVSTVSENEFCTFCLSASVKWLFFKRLWHKVIVLTHLSSFRSNLTSIRALK